MSIGDLGPLSALLLEAVLWTGLVVGLAVLFVIIALWLKDWP